MSRTIASQPPTLEALGGALDSAPVTIPTVNLMTGKTGRYAADMVRHYPQLEALAPEEIVVTGGDASLSDGFDFVFESDGSVAEVIIEGGPW